MCVFLSPLSQLPVLSVAGLIAVTAGQAAVTVTELSCNLIGPSGERRSSASDRWSSSGQEIGRFWG